MLFTRAHAPAFGHHAKIARAPLARAFGLRHQIVVGNVVVHRCGGFMVAALRAEGTIFRAVARAHIGDGAHFDLVAAIGFAQAIRAGHQPGQIVMIQLQQPQTFVGGGLATREDSFQNGVDAMVGGVVEHGRSRPAVWLLRRVMLAYERQLSNTMVTAMYQWIKHVQRGLFPATCVLCGCDAAGELDLCTACRADLPHVLRACPRCGLPLATEAAGECGACVTDPPAFTRTSAPFRYEDPVKHLIHALKFNRKLYVARVLGELMAGHYEQQGARPDVIIPVPLHPGRLRERGFNQALELARPVAARLHIPINIHACARTRGTAAQSDLPAAQRAKNIQGAFAMRAQLHVRRVAIIDDVMTTGATANELAGMLIAHGVEEVHIWVCARAVMR